MYDNVWKPDEKLILDHIFWHFPTSVKYETLDSLLLKSKITDYFPLKLLMLFTKLQ